MNFIRVFSNMVFVAAFFIKFYFNDSDDDAGLFY